MGKERWGGLQSGGMGAVGSVVGTVPKQAQKAELDGIGLFLCDVGILL